MYPKLWRGFQILIGIFLFVLVGSVQAQLTPPVVESVAYYSNDGMNVQVVVTLTNLTPYSSVTRSTVGVAQACVNVPGYVINERTSVPVLADASGRLVDVFTYAGCLLNATVTYFADGDRQVSVVVQYNRFQDALLVSPVPLGYNVGVEAEVTQNETLYFFPFGHGIYDGQVRELVAGTRVETINGPVMDVSGVIWYQVRTLSGVYAQQGWVRDTSLTLISEANVVVNPAGDLSWYDPQGKVPEGSLRINVRPQPTVRREGGSYVAPPTDQLRPAQVVNVLAQTSNGLWFYVESLDGNITGWVCSHFLLVNFHHQYLANNHPGGWYIASPPVVDGITPPEDCSGQVWY